MRGKHEIKAAVIRGQIYIYIHSWIERENSHREKKGRTASNKEKKEREREELFVPLSFRPLLSSRLKKGSPEILERTKGPVEYRVVENHPGTITALLNLRCRES